MCPVSHQYACIAINLSNSWRNRHESIAIELGTCDSKAANWDAHDGKQLNSTMVGTRWYAMVPRRQETGLVSVKVRDLAGNEERLIMARVQGAWK